MNTVLVCDDEKDIVSALKIYLESEGYAVECAYDGAQALALLESRDISLVLMDIMMPVMDGISAMVKIRERSNVPVILLTAKGEDTDKILGLNVGADDYITKPFNPLEVLARVRSQLRRYTMLGAAQIRQSCLTVGGISMDDSSKTVTVDGEPAALTPTEYDILRLLMENPGQVFHPRKLDSRIVQCLAGSGEGVRQRNRLFLIADQGDIRPHDRPVFHRQAGLLGNRGCGLTDRIDAKVDIGLLKSLISLAERDVNLLLDILGLADQRRQLPDQDIPLPVHQGIALPGECQGIFSQNQISLRRK